MDHVEIRNNFKVSRKTLTRKAMKLENMSVFLELLAILSNYEKKFVKVLFTKLLGKISQYNGYY